MASSADAILDAAVDCLVDGGYAALTTRRVAERAGVAQSTVMHHFPARGTLVVETGTRLAARLAERTLGAIDLRAVRTPERRDALLDQAWAEFTSPEALAAASLWAASWSEPDLAATLRELEERIGAIITRTTQAVLPETGADPRLVALLDATVSMIRGLVASIPIWGEAVITERWRAIKPILLEAAATLLDG